MTRWLCRLGGATKPRPVGVFIGLLALARWISVSAIRYARRNLGSVVGESVWTMAWKNYGLRHNCGALVSNESVEESAGFLGEATAALEVARGDLAVHTVRCTLQLCAIAPLGDCCDETAHRVATPHLVPPTQVVGRNPALFVALCSGKGGEPIGDTIHPRLVDHPAGIPPAGAPTFAGPRVPRTLEGPG